MTPMISLAAATGLVDAIELAGADPDEVLGPLELDRSTVSNPHGFIPARRFAEILEETARATGDECFGLHFGEQFNPRDVGPLAYVVLNSSTMLRAIENIVRYLRVYNEAARVSLGVEGRLAYVRHELDLGRGTWRQQHECAMALGLNLIRLMAGSRWAPAEIQFAHQDPHQTAEHLRVFGTTVSFGCPTNALVLERELVDRQVPAADERLYPILREYLDRALEEVPREDPLAVSVRKAIGECVREGDPTLAHVARKLAMSPRTLQRRLAEQEMDFKALVDDTRRRFSLHYLRDPKHTLTEIAYMLGYSEISAFSRAFRRWTGSTLLDYRRRTPRSVRGAAVGKRRPRSG